MFDVVVVGSGLAGSTSARVLAEAGYRVLVVERRKHVGGNVYDERIEGITVHKYGPHIFHTNSKRAWDFLNRFTRFRPYQHRVLSYTEGEFYPFPINLKTLERVFGRPFTPEEAREFLEKEARKCGVEDPGNFEEAVISQVGERLYEMFFKGYTEKQWGKDPRELSPELAKRIPVRLNRDDRYFTDRYQGVPIGGYTGMVERILDHPNVSILLNVDYIEFRKELKPKKLLVYTGELDAFFDRSFGKLEYRSLRFEYFVFDEDRHQPVATVNYPNDYDWTRLTEYKHFLDEKGNKTVVVAEYPVSEGEPYYVVPTVENEERREKYMLEVERLERTGEFLFIGRLAQYKYYNMDQVVESALEKVSEWLRRVS